MRKPKICKRKVCLKKVVRTFLQTVIGYLLTNVALQLGGVDFTNRNVLKNALIGLAVAAFSAGASAVMNLEKKSEETTDE